MPIVIGHWRTLVGYDKIRESYFSRKVHKETKVDIYIPFSDTLIKITCIWVILPVNLLLSKV